MSECGTGGPVTADDRGFCSNCGAHLRWDDPEEGEAPTAILTSEDPPTTVMEVEEPRTVAPTEAVRITLADPARPSAAPGPPRVRVPTGGRVQLTGTVSNQSGIVDSCELRLAGLDPAWWTIAGRPDAVRLPGRRARAARGGARAATPRAGGGGARLGTALVAQSRTHGPDAAKAGCLAILFAIAMIATLQGGAIGVWIVLLGGIAAVAAGALARG